MRAGETREWIRSDDIQLIWKYFLCDSIHIIFKLSKTRLKSYQEAKIVKSEEIFDNCVAAIIAHISWLFCSWTWFTLFHCQLLVTKTTDIWKICKMCSLNLSWLMYHLWLVPLYWLSNSGPSYVIIMQVSLISTQHHHHLLTNAVLGGEMSNCSCKTVSRLKYSQKSWLIFLSPTS